MDLNERPKLSEEEIEQYLKLASDSKKSRYPKLLHKHGDSFNSVFNFMMKQSYMQPHLHPGIEKIENIYLIHGMVASIFFDDQGKINKSILLEKGKSEFIEVPAYTWHTYVILSDYAITYETMAGVYSPDTWKTFANWAPVEGITESLDYLAMLKRDCGLKFTQQL